MTAPNYCVLEGDPVNGISPRRPDALCEDMGGLQFQDDPNDPPRPNEHLAAADFKQVEMLVQRLAKMSPMMTIEFSVSGTTVTVTRVVCVRASVTTSSITATYVSGGHYTFAWASGTLPAATRYPRINSSNSSDTVMMSTQMTAASTVTVWITNEDGSPSNTTGTLSIDIWGEGT